MARKDVFSLREERFGAQDLERLEERLEMQFLSVIEEDYCSLHVCTSDCSEGVWCAGGFCPCDGSHCFCHGDCPAHCSMYCLDGGGW